MKKYFLPLLAVGLLVLGCSKNDDDGFSGPRDLDPQNFMWQAMNIWYFWQADVPNL
ncbi:MAG: carboxyl-terminal protease, partial [Eudoraea sp.]|nr:carboxyl-terminal protease [Eudoraea sp.]